MKHVVSNAAAGGGVVPGLGFFSAGTARLTVESPAFQNGGDIPFENTQYRGNVFPGLSWSHGPSRTRSYVIIMQDSDGLSDGMPILHWTMFNIPKIVTKLDAR